jgi:hypothetical protein
MVLTQYYLTLKRQLTAFYLRQSRIGTDFFGSDNPHLMGESATHPIRPSSGALAALLVLAGMSLPRPRVLPAHPMTTCSGAFNYRFKV